MVIQPLHNGRGRLLLTGFWSITVKFFSIHTLSIRPLKNRLENLEKAVPRSHLARLATHQHCHQEVPQGPVYVFQRCKNETLPGFFYFKERTRLKCASRHTGIAETQQIPPSPNLSVTSVAS